MYKMKCLKICTSCIYSYYILVAAFLCFIINLFIHGQLIFAVSNSIILFLSWKLLRVFTNNRVTSNSYCGRLYIPVIIFLGLIPIFSFNPYSASIPVLLLLSIILFIVSFRLQFLGKIFIIFSLVFLVLGNLIAGRIISIPPEARTLSIDKEKVVFVNKAIPLFIEQHQKELVLPRRIHLYLYNQSVFLPYILANLGSFISLRNFYDTLLLANLYPLFYGIYYYAKNYSKHSKMILSWSIISSLAISINKSNDKFLSLYMASPLLLVLILIGLTKINIRLYLLMLIFSIAMLFIPRI